MSLRTPGDTVVVFYTSKNLVLICRKFEKDCDRPCLVYGLINAYQLFGKMSIIEPESATLAELKCFHSSDFLDHLTEVSDANDLEKLTWSKDSDQYGLAYDCPMRNGVLQYVSLVAGASIDAARRLLQHKASICINFSGGWHHSNAAKASGFCYINDCVLSILKLREGFPKVLYIDLDAHHGDAVQDAFYSTDKVFTFSLHRYEPGYFPGTGSIDEVGSGRGKHYCLNIPLKEGTNDAQYCHCLNEILPLIFTNFVPNAVVVQCGADALAFDPIGQMNLTAQSYLRALTIIRSWQLPMLILGGGGYHSANTARLWTQISAFCVGEYQNLTIDIPEHSFLMKYGPDYELTLNASNIKSRLTDTELTEIVTKAKDSLNMLAQSKSITFSTLSGTTDNYEFH